MLRHTSERVSKALRGTHHALLFFFLGLLLKEITIELAAAQICHSVYYTEPECIDHPSGYGCECGPGFHWNTKMCMSSAIDSRLEFREQRPVRYTLLLGRAFPELHNFTIAFWINVTDPNHQGTILSYKYEEINNLVRIMSGPKLQLEVWGKKVMTNITLEKKTWYHVAWTWRHHDGVWKLYLNGSLNQRGRGATVRKAIPSGGELVLGQSSRPKVTFNETYAFTGDLSYMNIWSKEMTLENITRMYNSCIFMHCGNAVQWAEFRSGTRGAMRLRWPSGINQPCFNELDAASACDKYCSDVIGAQCNEDTVENIKWTRTPAENNISVPCPGLEELAKDNVTVDYATRPCFRTEQNDGIWGKALIDSCISTSLLALKNEFKTFLRTSVVEEVPMLALADKLHNHTKMNSYTNPIDIATVIDLLGMLVKTQGVSIRDVSWKDGAKTFARTQTAYNPTRKQTKVFTQLVTGIVDNLLDRRNEVAWNATQPSGAEGEALMKVMRNFSEVVAKRLEYHVKDRGLAQAEAVIRQSKPNIAFKIQIWWIEEPIRAMFPDAKDQSEFELKPSQGSVELLNEKLRMNNITGSPVFVAVSTFLYPTFARVLPNHSIKRSKENNVNTPVVALYLYIEDMRMKNLTSPVLIKLPYLDTFNISNPECVRLREYHEEDKDRWIREGCYMKTDYHSSGDCACHVPGVFAITTDMYNVNWDKGEKRPVLMNPASYIGCSVSALLCLISLIMLIYLRTTSSTAALHKNLSLSIICGQVVFMVGIDKYDYKVVCEVFAILIHYFFLATYSWIMNEAFNLYIVITYSAHSHRENTESGSLLRYYILGWIIPGVLVGAFVGTHAENYYARDMCWIAWGNIWLFVGPALGIIAITILVLIFTAKEQNENSYTKSEKTNKIIQIHSKALWTQTILLTVCWSFAFISLRMTDSILKYLYAMFNCLQVRAVLKSERKKKNLAMHGYDYSDEQSLDSMESYSGIMEKENADTLRLETKDAKAMESLKYRQRSHIEVSSDDASDCEMITSV